MDAAPSWNIPPEHIALQGDEVHVWRVDLALPAERVHALEQTLAADEQQRASRFHFLKDRNHFIVARGLLRAMLGRYLASDPRAVHFSVNQYGKPALAGESGQVPLYFNLSHSHEMALYAFTSLGEVGIDLEYINRNVEILQLAERFFSPGEVAMLRAVPSQLQCEAFFNCWTRKEAYIKARGMGLSLDLQLFDVSLTPGMPAALLGSREVGQDAARWSLYDLSPGLGYKAALAIAGHPLRLTFWQWPEPEA